MTFETDRTSQMPILRTTEGIRAHFGVPVRVRFARLKVLLGLAMLIAVLAAQPFPSFILDTLAVIGPDDEGISATALAIRDSVGLAVWYGAEHVKGCLITEGRSATRSACIDINGSYIRPDDQKVDAAASDSGYLVVMRQILYPTGEMVLAGVLISRDGLVVRRETIAVRSIGDIGLPAVASGGGNYLVAWSEYDGQFDRLLFTRVALSGQVLDSAPRRIKPGAGGQFSQSVCYGAGYFLVVYHYVEYEPHSEGIRCARVRPDGAVLDTQGICVRRWTPTGADHTGEETTVGFDGRNFVIGWTEYLTPSGQLRAARLTPSGEVLDSGGIVVGVDSVQPNTSVACLRDTSLFVWNRWVYMNRRLTLCARRLGGDGRLLDTGYIVIAESTPSTSSSLGGATAAACSGVFVVAYKDLVVSPLESWGVGSDVLTRRLSAAGEMRDSVPVLISYTASQQIEADVASDGQEFLAVWSDRRSGDYAHDCAVYGLRFSADGRRLDSTGIRISQWLSHTPSVGYGGGCYLVAWTTDLGEETADVWMRRIGRDGRPLDTCPVQLPTVRPLAYYSRVDVAFGDGLFLVTWYEGRGHAYAARVTPGGVLLDTVPIRLELGNFAGGPQSVASDGHSFLVVRINESRMRLYGLRVGSDGRILDSTEIVIYRVVNELPPQVAFGAGVYLVVEPRVAKAWRVSPDGVVLDTAIYGGMSEPRVTFDGTNFFLAGVGYGTPPREMRGKRITPSGVNLDPQALLLVDLRDESVQVMRPYYGLGVAADSQDRVSLVFSTFESNPYVSPRVRASVFPAITGAVSEPAVPSRTPPLYAVTVGASSMSAAKPAVLLDISGRRVMEVHPGANDVRKLSPGVYFITPHPGPLPGAEREKPAVTKVVITR